MAAARPAGRKKKRGRPTLYSDRLAATILARMSRGETLRKICKRAGMPAAETVSMWAIDDRPPGFAERYARARQMQAEAMAEEALEIADTTKDANKARLQVDTRKWMASKINPARFADRTKLEHGGDGGGPIEFTFSLDNAGANLSPDAAAG